MKDILLPADTYIVVNQTILTEIDKNILINLYEPIIGPISVSLYLTLWSDLDKHDLISSDYTHHHLMTILKSSLNDILLARKSLESLGLIKTYIKRNDNINEYLYELYSPLSAYEFFNHPVLSVLLLNNIGEIEYNNLRSYYKKINVKKSDYEEITSTMNDTFKSINNTTYENDLIRRKKELNINLANVIDFDLVINSLPKDLVNSHTFTKKTKELINELAFIYNVDSVGMSEFIRLVIDNVGIVDKEKLREVVRKNYEFNNSGSLPTIVYRSQPDYLKSPSGDSSPKSKMIKVFENTKPYDFLKFKNKGVKPSSRELKILESLAIDYNLPPGVINVLVDYSIRVKDGKLNKAYLESIASVWNRKGIKTVNDAMNEASKYHVKKDTSKVSNANKKSVSPVPSWMNEDNKEEKMSDEELLELEKEMSIYK